VQGQLNKDDKVEILGESGDFYKITPPAFAAFWIYSQYVDLGGKTAPTEITKVGDGTVKVEMSSDGTTTKPVITAEAPKQETPAEPTVDPASVRGKVEAVRKEMMAEYAKPAEQRDLKRIIEKFKAIDTGDDKYAKQVVSYYTQYMDNQLKTLDEVASITKSIDSNKAIVTKITTDLNTRQLAIQVQETGPKAYNAEGVLKASGLFPGSKVMPKRWVVRDAYTDRITAYVQCTTGDLDLENYVGKHVGVWGSETYDKDLGLHIVEAKQVKELPAAASTPIPPQATTQPDAVATVKAAPKAEVAAKPEPTTKPAKTEATATSQPSFKAAAKATSDDEDADSDVESLAAKATTQPTTNPSVQSSMSPVSPDKVK